MNRAAAWRCLRTGANLQAAQRTWTLKTDIGDLASWLFGYEKTADLWPDMPEEMKKELEKIQTVQGIWLDEIV